MHRRIWGGLRDSQHRLYFSFFFHHPFGAPAPPAMAEAWPLGDGHCLFSQPWTDPSSSPPGYTLLLLQVLTEVLHPPASIPCIVCDAQSCPTLCNPMVYSQQAPLSIGFPRQEYWSGLPFPSPKCLFPEDTLKITFLFLHFGHCHTA